MSLIKYIDIPQELWLGICQTGSSVICNPPVENTDIDFVICTTSYYEICSFLIRNGFRQSCADEEEYDLENEGFECYRKNNINLIVTENYDWYKKWVFSTVVAMKLNLLKKEDRITLFKAILYNKV